jgi:NAD+ diphosphatase
MQFKPPDDFSATLTGAAWWFAFRYDQLLVTHPFPQRVGIPIVEDIEDPGPHSARRLHLGFLDGRPCFASELSDDSAVPEGMTFQGLRRLFGILDETAFKVAGLGLQLLHWDKARRFCGRCGEPTRNKADERAKICTACSEVDYPRISPAVIMAVIRNGRILLARTGRYPNRKLYSVLAGYVEPGETLEEAVRRELQEEVTIEAGNIRYFGSQPWPCSGSLMVAFTADYAGGEIQEDGREILHAAWFSPEDLPEIPAWGSISRQLIDWFIRTHGG